MASIYQLIPLPLGPLAPYDLTTRAVLGAIWDRYRLSSYQVTGGNDKWYDYDVDEVYCVYDQTDLAQMLGVSRRTVQRALDVLQARLAERMPVLHRRVYQIVPQTTTTAPN